MDETKFKLNTFKFTVRLKDNAESEKVNRDRNSFFLKKLHSFISKQPIEESLNNTFSNYSEYRYKHETDFTYCGQNGREILNLNESGHNILSLKITSTYDYTFDFKGLSELSTFEDVSYSKQKEQSVYRGYKKIYEDEELPSKRIQILYDFLRFIREENLYIQTNIKSIGFSISFFSPYSYLEQRLIKFFKKKENNFYDTYCIGGSEEIYTIAISHYRAKIHNIYLFLNHCRGARSTTQRISIPPLLIIEKPTSPKLIQEQQKANFTTLNLVSVTDDLSDEDTRVDDILKEKKNEELTQDEIIKIIDSVINDKNITVKIDSLGRYYLYSLKNHTTIHIDKTRLDFYPYIDPNSNYFKLYHSDKNIYEVNLQKNRKKPFIIFTKEKSTYEFKVNNWVTSDRKILKKYGSKKHQYKLSDDVEDISQNIIDFTKKFSLIELNDKELLSEVVNKSDLKIISRKKFNDKIIHNGNAIDYMKFTKSNVSDVLKKIIN